MLTLRPAADLDFPGLLALWNTAYGGYLVPLTFDEAMLGRHLRRSGMDLERSVVGQIGGELFGLSLAAFRDQGSSCRAWIGGFGVGEPFRRRGLATRLMTAHLERLESEGVGEVWLEVIDANPAREVYRRCGFAETRELKMFEGSPAAGTDAGEILSAEALAERHAALNPDRPTWRRELPTLADSLAHDGAGAIGVEGAYAVAAVQGERLSVLDAAAADESAANAILGALALRWPGLPMRLLDEPADTPLARACAAAGFANPLNQLEMVRRA